MTSEGLGRLAAATLIAVAVSGAPASAQEGPAREAAAQRPLSLEAAVAEGLAGNAELAIARAEARAIEAGARGADAFLWPAIGVEAGLVRSTDPVFAFGTKLRQGRFSAGDLALDVLNDPEPVEDWASTIGVSWRALSPESWMARRAARSGAEAAAWKSVRAAQSTELGVRLRYAEAVRALAHARAAGATEEAARATLDRFTRRQERGLLTEADRLQAEAELSAARAARLEAERAAREARQSLGVFLGWEPGVLPLPTDTLGMPGVVDEGRFEATRRADLRALAAQAAAREAEVRRATLAFLPTIDAFGRVAAHSRDAFDREDDEWTVGMSLRWTAFAGFSRAAERRRAAETLRAARLRHEQARRAAAAEVEDAERTIESAAARIEAALAGRRAAEAATTLVRRRFEEGLATPAELLQAEARQATMKSRAIDALADYQVALARSAFVRSPSEPEDLP